MRRKLLAEGLTSGLVLALGANISGIWGPPLATLRRTIAQLPTVGIQPLRVSALYETAPLGGGRQPRFLNAVIIARASHSPARLLALLKHMELCAGRRSRQRFGARPLDLDIIDFGGRVIGWPPGRRRSLLVLPHPEAHRRAFVLVPLLDVLPAWYHPALKISVSRLLRRLARRPGDVRRKLDSGWISCDEDV